MDLINKKMDLINKKMDLNTIIEKYEKSDPKMDFLLWFTQNYKSIKETQTKALNIADVSKSFTAEEVGNMLATKFSTIEEAIHYFDTID